MTSQFDGLTATLLASIATCLPREMSGDVMQGWIQNPRALKDALRNALCPPTEVAETDSRIWKRIKLGTGLKTADDFRKSVKDNDMRLGDWASDILGKEAFTAATEETEVDLVRRSAKDLGLKGNARFDQICVRAKEQGLERCPAEVGPQLRLQYLDQPKNEVLIIAMEAIRASYGNLNVFNVEHDDDGRWLNANYGNPDNVWNPDYQFVFVSRNFFIYLLIFWGVRFVYRAQAG